MATYNRYNGSTGAFIRLPEPFDEQPRPGPARPPEPPAGQGAPPPEPPAGQSGPPPDSGGQRREPGHRPPPGKPAPQPGPPRRGAAHRPPAKDSLEGLLSGLGNTLSGRLGGLETEDLLLLAIVYLMYRESGDRQLLIVLAALLLF